jgi:thioredoxin-related protein
MRKSRLVGWILPLTLLFGASMLGALRADHPGGDIPWVYDFRAALQRAQRTHRPLLVNFHAPACEWCAKMDAETFTDTKVVALSRRYLCVRLDSEVDGAVCARYGVLDYPTTLLLDSEGKVVTRLSGYTPPERFAPAMSVALQALHR